MIRLEVPPLRERSEDIPMLIGHCLKKIAGQGERAELKLSREAMQALMHYDFPGNVRELENILERATTLCEGNAISLDDLQLPATATGERQTEPGAVETDRALERGSVPLDTYMDNIEKDVLLKALEQTRYNKTAAAKQLGITFRALRYRLKKLGLD